MTAEVAAAILDALGCSGDPFYYQGTEYDVSDLCSTFYDEGGESPRANRLQIVFFARKSWMRGTLADMILERLGERHGAVRTGKPRTK